MTRWCETRMRLKAKAAKPERKGAPKEEKGQASQPERWTPTAVKVEKKAKAKEKVKREKVRTKVQRALAKAVRKVAGVTIARAILMTLSFATVVAVQKDKGKE